MFIFVIVEKFVHKKIFFGAAYRAFRLSLPRGIAFLAISAQELPYVALLKLTCISWKKAKTYPIKTVEDCATIPAAKRLCSKQFDKIENFSGTKSGLI